MPTRSRDVRTVLYVEDNEAQRYAVGRLLRHAGFEVIEAATGEEALRLVLYHPDLVLLDVRLPDTTGFDVCRRIKAMPQTAAIPVVHLSATFITSDSKVHGLDSGADGYLTQPIEPAELIATVKALIRGRELWEQTRRTRPAVVLSVHAQAETLHTRRLVLESAGYVVLAAHTREQAISLLKTQNVDAVLLDAELPQVDVVATTEAIKKTRPNIPVIQVGTTNAPLGGADLALVKAEGTESILRVLKRLLKQPSAAAGQ